VRDALVPIEFKKWREMQIELCYGLPEVDCLDPVNTRNYGNVRSDVNLMLRFAFTHIEGGVSLLYQLFLFNRGGNSFKSKFDKGKNG
jgi:hypothetical protein